MEEVGRGDTFMSQRLNTVYRDFCLVIIKMKEAVGRSRASLLVAFSYF